MGVVGMFFMYYIFMHQFVGSYCFIIIYEKLFSSIFVPELNEILLMLGCLFSWLLCQILKKKF